MHSVYIKRAIELANTNIDKGGGPFGAVIVKNGKIVAEAGNSVTIENDPTAHAEIQAIRKAAKKIESFDLSDCTIYTSCEPCPMCLGAIYWARIKEVYFSADRYQAGLAGFSDNMIYEELEKPLDKRKLKMEQIEKEASDVLFGKWKDKSDKEPY